MIRLQHAERAGAETRSLARDLADTYEQQVEYYRAKLDVSVEETRRAAVGAPEAYLETARHGSAEQVTWSHFSALPSTTPRPRWPGASSSSGSPGTRCAAASRARVWSRR